MKNFIEALLLIVTLQRVCAQDRFFISGPSVFHIDVNEKVFVQLGGAHLNTHVTIYLENELTGTVVSERKTISCVSERATQTVGLMINNAVWSTMEFKSNPYLLLVAESPMFRQRYSTRVSVSTRRGYIFIQTDQPHYNPSKKVKYRIFILDHSLRPQNAVIAIKIFNPAGGRVSNVLRTAEGGIFSSFIEIPDAVRTGTWRITAHFVDDEAHAAFREFKIQRFVLPTFDVSLHMEQKYVLLNADRLDVTISAAYSYGEKVGGAYHFHIGVLRERALENPKPIFISAARRTGSVTEGTATVTVQIAQLNEQLHNQLNATLSDLMESGANIQIGVAVTNVQSGEVQRSDVSLPIIANKYTIDLSRSRSFLIPGAPLDVVAAVRLPDGSPAVGITVEISVLDQCISQSAASRIAQSERLTTDQQGAVAAVFRAPTGDRVAVQVSADGQQECKVLQHASSPSNEFLYLDMDHKTYSVGNVLTISYNDPQNKIVYYMVLSRGIIVRSGVFNPDTKQLKLDITAEMVPSLRLIGYYYGVAGDIIADSVWADVEDQCEIDIKVGGGQYRPSQKVNLKIDLHGQRAKVALLAVDKAIYALSDNNKLTAKQVFSHMESYDLGCMYGGGPDPASTINNAGLSFITHAASVWRKGSCEKLQSRHRRSLDIEQEMTSLKSNFSSEELQECCHHGFLLLPMRRTCEERAARISLLRADPLCEKAFLDCCLKAETLRREKAREDARKGLSRAASIEEIENYFFEVMDKIVRRRFPPSFAFSTHDINDVQNSVLLNLPDSITTWEIQAITVSPTSGFCVAQPSTILAFKEIFVSLTLPYSVRKHEQISISPIIYNYGDTPRQLAVHMEQSKGLCSPGSTTAASFVNITLEPVSSQFVSFTTIPMETGSIPIKIRLYDIIEHMGQDAVEKILNVQSEGIEQRVEQSYMLKLDGRGSEVIILDGRLPHGTVPESTSNIFISMEGQGFNKQQLVNLLSPGAVHDLIRLPKGCLEQTMSKMAPSVLAVRYLDRSQQWFELAAGARDKALQKIEHGYVTILGSKSLKDKSYGSWTSTRPSVWMTAYVVKLMSLVAERQTASSGEQGRMVFATVNKDEITQPVEFLLSVQDEDGMFDDQAPVYHRGLQAHERVVFTTAYTALALQLSLSYNTLELKTKGAISKATSYLRLQFHNLQDEFVVAITAYCLSVCMPEGTDVSFIWPKLSAAISIGEDPCAVRSTDANIAKGAATKVEAVAYALLTAMAVGQSDWADNAACWLISQTNYNGGFTSTQDTVVALEALAEYELGRTIKPFPGVTAEFSVQGKSNVATLSLRNRRESVETELKQFIGNMIVAQLTGQGNATLKVLKVFHLLEPEKRCDNISITVRVEGTVSYTDKILEEFDYYDEEDYSQGGADRVARSTVESTNVYRRVRRDNVYQVNPDIPLTYTICVSANTNLTGMAIADITLLSGSEPVLEDLDRLKLPHEQYISHYELTKGRLLLYFDQLLTQQMCIGFKAKQVLPIDLVQPAPAMFYDYYEPNTKCTVFYSAPRRSKTVSKLCSGDVCQCAEKPCHKTQDIFTSTQDNSRTGDYRHRHACFHPIVDYVYVVEVVEVSVKSNFELYTTKIMDVLKSHGDQMVRVTSTRVFARRLQCKGSLMQTQRYLIMGKDGATTDTNGAMQYLLESNTWVENVPDEGQCKASRYANACDQFHRFVAAFRLGGCKQ